MLFLRMAAYSTVCDRVAGKESVRIMNGNVGRSIACRLEP